MATDEEIAIALRLKNQKQVSDELKQVAKRVDDVGDAAGRTGKKAGVLGKVSSATGKLAKTVGKAGLAGAAAGLGTVLYKGFSRLNNIENARSKLDGLGHSAKAVDGIMANALASVDKTAFGLDEAASTAANSVAAGIKPGKELERTLKTIADAASMGQTSMTDMGSIFNKVAITGKAQGDVLQQLSERDIPIIQLLAKELGVTGQEVYKMASDGEIGFKKFRKALEGGVTGAALKAGDTTTGAFKNMGAAAGRLGAILLGGVYPMIKGALGGITNGLNTLTKRAEPAVARVTSWLEDRFIPAIKGSGDSMGPLVDKAKSMGKALWGVFTDVASAVWNLVGPLVRLAKAYLPDIWNAVQPVVTWVGEKLWGALEKVGKVLKDNVSPALATVIDWLAENKAVVYGVAAAVGTYLALMNAWRLAMALWIGAAKIVMVLTKGWAIAQAILNGVMAMNPIVLVIAALVGLAVGLVYAYKNSEKFRAVVQAVWAAVKTAFKVAWEFIRDKVFKPLKTFFTVIVPAAATVLKNKIVGAWENVRQKTGAVKDWIVEKWNAVINFFKSIPGKISSAASGMWDGIKNSFKGAINWIIGKWNSLQLTIGGNSFDLPMGMGSVSIPSMTLNTPDIPLLHSGGTTTSGGSAIVKPDEEAVVLPSGASVIPLPVGRVPENALGGGGRQGPIQVPVYLNGKKIAEAVYDETRNAVARR